MLLQFAKSIRQYKRDTILTPIFVLLEVFIEITIPLCMAEVIDRGIDGKDQSFLISFGSFLLVLVLLGLVAGLLSGFFCARASAGFSRNLRKDMYDRIQEFSFDNIDKFSASSLVTRLTTDVTNVQMAFMMLIRVAIRAPFMLIFSLLAAFSVNADLSMMFLVAIPVLGIGLLAIIHFSYPYFTKVFHIYDELNGVVQENVIGMRVVKSFVREDFEEEKFGKVSGQIYNVFSKAERIVALNMPLMQFVVYACMLLLSWFGAKAIVLSGGTDMTTGDLTSMISYAMSILSCLMMLSMVMVILNIANASAKRISEVLQEKSTLQNKKHPIRKMEDSEIVFEHVGFGYGADTESKCLKDISLRIPAGSTLGIVGGTGSGKSSLVQLIPRLYDVTEGRVTIGGVDVKDYDLYTLRNEVAMVLQKNELFSGTIKENLRWGDSTASDEEVVQACKLAQADSFISTFPDGYDTYIEQGGTNVSGGQKQRLCIARALLKKPKILILDDSTSAVDTKTDALIRKAFLEEIPDSTKIIIAQRISSVEDADQILVLEGGRISALGTHEQLIKENKIYREMYLTQMKGGEEDAKQ